MSSQVTLLAFFFSVSSSTAGDRVLCFYSTQDDDHAGQCTSSVRPVVDDDSTTSTTTALASTTSTCGGGGCGGGGGDTHERCAVWPVDQDDDAGLEATTDATDFLSTTTTTKGDALARATKQFGVRQLVEGERALETLDLIAQSVLYMASYSSSRPSSSVDHHLVHNSIINNDQSCRNRHELCAFWAVVGECDDNPAYMHAHCGPSCRSCHRHTTDMKKNTINDTDNILQEEDDDERCRRLVDDQKEPALNRPGDVNRLFERIVHQAPGNRTLSLSSEQQQRRRHDEEQQQSPMMPIYTVHVHSRPGQPQQQSHLSLSASALSSSSPPWVVTMDNFLTDDECHGLIALGYEYGYRPSAHVGGGRRGGPREQQPEMRTSETAWCSDQMGCRWRDLPQRLHERMATVLDLPSSNYSEDFQLLKYEAGQYYRTHHDYIPQQGKWGPASTQQY
jgi:prolyl 4-hydroxylase